MEMWLMWASIPVSLLAIALSIASFHYDRLAQEARMRGERHAR